VSSKKLSKARAEHDKWLEKRGLLPGQVKAKNRSFDKPIDRMPDLKSGRSLYPSLGNGFAPVRGKKQLPADAKQFPIGHLHKQGLTLITSTKPEDLQYYGGKKA
jgi:hypothetical protein